MPDYGNWNWGEGMAGGAGAGVGGSMMIGGEPITGGIAGAALGGFFGDDTPSWLNWAVDPLGLRKPAAKVNFEPIEFAPGQREDRRAFQKALYDKAMGWGGPSVAESQMREGLNEAQAQAHALGRSQRGTSAAAALRMAQRAGSQAAADTAAKASQLRAQEQLGARDQYSQYVGSLDKIRAQQKSLYNQLMMQKAIKEQKAVKQKRAGIMGAAGAALGTIFSDKRGKTNIKKLDDEKVRDFLDALVGYKYKYKKDESLAPDSDKTHYGVMAQDLAKTEMGKPAIKKIDVTKIKLKPGKEKPEDIETKERLTIDVREALSAALAGMGNLHDRIKKLEK